MTRGCYEAGDAGMCGIECEELQEGKCDVIDDFVEQSLRNLTLENIQMLKEQYPDKSLWIENILRNQILDNKKRITTSDYNYARNGAFNIDKYEMKLEKVVVELERFYDFPITIQYYMTYHTIYQGAILSTRHYHLDRTNLGKFDSEDVEDILKLMYEVEREELISRWRI